MKALKLLEKYGHHIKLILQSCDEYIVDEAIAELKELENRSCDNCIFFQKRTSQCLNWAVNIMKDDNKPKSDGAYLSVEKKFCCNMWEKKNEPTN